MREPDQYFPLKLSDFEYYAYRDETAENPMVMVLRIHIEGTLDAAAFRTSLKEAVHHHPLLRCVIDQTGRQLQWQLSRSSEPQLSCTWHDGEHPPVDCPPVRLDLKHEVGARFELRVCPHRSVLICWLHHACVDGVGGIGFLSDVFALYGQKTAAAEDDRPEIRFPEPQALLNRGAIPHLGERRRRWTEWLRGPSRFLLGKNYCIEARDSTQPQPCNVRSVLQTAVLPGAVVRQLKRLAATKQVSTNDLCMMVYLQQIAHWTQSHRTARDTDLFRVLMPISMRTPEHDRISAANVLSYVFQPFRRRDCRNPEALLSAIHQRSTEMIHNNEGAVLLRLFGLVQRVPGLFWLSRKLQPSFATAVLANVGELKRVFGNRFPLRRGRVVAGNVIIQRIDGIAPLRKNTNVVISFGGYGGDLIMNLRANPNVMSAAESELFLNQVVSRLTTLAETQSLTVVGDARKHSGNSGESLKEETLAG